MFLNWFLYTRLRTKKVIIYSDHDSLYLISGVKPVVYCKVYIFTYGSIHDPIGRRQSTSAGLLHHRFHQEVLSLTTWLALAYAATHFSQTNTLHRTHFISMYDTENNDWHPFSTDDVSVIFTLPSSNQLLQFKEVFCDCLLCFYNSRLSFIWNTHILWHIKEILISKT